MTLRQLQLWGHLAAQQMDRNAKLVAVHLSEPIGEMFTALARAMGSR